MITYNLFIFMYEALSIKTKENGLWMLDRTKLIAKSMKKMNTVAYIFRKVLIDFQSL